MENQDKKKNIQVIDESYLMSMMAGNKDEKKPTQVEASNNAAQELPVPKERGKTKKNNELDYEKLFLKNPDTNARNGKSVYIRPSFHERLSRIVQVIGEDKLTIYAYLDNVLDHHFQEFGEQITKSYNDKYKPIL